MYPYERSLVQRMKGRPFVLIGVNNDEDREAIQKLAKREKLAWRSFWDGPENHIAQQWGVTGWPSLFLIDHKGVVRDKNLHGKELDAAIEKLVKEAEKVDDAARKLEGLRQAAMQRRQP